MSYDGFRSRPRSQGCPLRWRNPESDDGAVRRLAVGAQRLRPSTAAAAAAADSGSLPRRGLRAAACPDTVGVGVVGPHALPPGARPAAAPFCCQPGGRAPPRTTGERGRGHQTSRPDATAVSSATVTAPVCAPRRLQHPRGHLGRSGRHRGFGAPDSIRRPPTGPEGDAAPSLKLNHVWDPKSPLFAAPFRDDYPPGQARPVVAQKKRSARRRLHSAPPRLQCSHRFTIGPRGPSIRHNLVQCSGQLFHNLFHRRRRAGLSHDIRLRHRRRGRTGPVQFNRTTAPSRVFCCREYQFELHRHFIDRDRLSSPCQPGPTGWGGHYPTFWYYAVLRLLLGHRPSSFRSAGLPGSEPNRSPRVRH
ncbi:MAG: hypothetical protein ACI9OJ_005290 [Myxococcota bacterium]|jgi:hypothetical protein